MIGDEGGKVARAGHWALSCGGGTPLSSQEGSEQGDPSLPFSVEESLWPMRGEGA